MRIGLDVGGTKIDAIALDDADNILAQMRVRTGFGPEAVVCNTVLAASGVADAAGLSLRSFQSLGVGIPGVVDPDTGVVRHAVNLGLRELNLGEVLADRVGLPVGVENDVNAASLGAARLLGLDGSMAYLNLGTGLAAGYVINGRLWRGRQGIAGEIGHIVVDPAGEWCACGQRGCLETTASGGWLARKWITDHPYPVLDIVDSADAGNPNAVTTRDDFVNGAAQAVKILALTADVETIVIGGGISNLGVRLLDLIRRALDQQASHSSFLASLRLSARVQLVPQGSPVAAFGAALAEPMMQDVAVV